MEQPRQSLLGRLWSDIRANPGVWIGVGITALVLVVGYLAYQNSQNSAAASGATGGGASPNSTNQPDWSSAVLGSDAGGQPSNAELAAELAAIAAYVQNQQTPNPSGTAAPPPPPPIPPKPKGPPAPQMGPGVTPGVVWSRTHPGVVSSSGGPYAAPGVR